MVNQNKRVMIQKKKVQTLNFFTFITTQQKLFSKIKAQNTSY